MSSPKVLILNQPFNEDTGGGITLTNLFTGWEKDKLAVVCSGRLLGSVPKMDICSLYYQLGHKEHKWVFPFSLLKRKYPSGIIQFDAQESSPLDLLPVPTKSKLRINLIMHFFYPILQYLGVLHLVSKFILSDDLCRWLDEYDPDVIYAQANSREDIILCIEVCKFLKKTNGISHDG